MRSQSWRMASVPGPPERVPLPGPPYSLSLPLFPYTVSSPLLAEYGWQLKDPASQRPSTGLKLSRVACGQCPGRPPGYRGPAGRDVPRTMNTSTGSSVSTVNPCRSYSRRAALP